MDRRIARVKKSWLSENGGSQLQAFLGVWGVKTGDIDDASALIRMAADVFELPVKANCAEMAAAVGALSKTRRKELARKNLTGAAPARDADDGAAARRVPRA